MKHRKLDRKRGLAILDFIRSNKSAKLILGIVTSGDVNATKILQEVCINILYNDNFHLTKQEVKKLSNHRRSIKNIAEAKTVESCVKLLKKFVHQEGHLLLVYMINCAIKRMNNEQR